MVWWLGLVVFCLNLPCGFFRARARRFSVRWFVAVHAPVPVIVALRILSGLGWTLSSFGVLVSAYFAGQLAGGQAGRARAP